MRTLILTRTRPGADDGGRRLRPAMAAYRDELARAGVLLDGAALEVDAATPAQGACAGYVLIQTRDRAEALEWARRCPVDPAGEVEARSLVDAPPTAGSPG